MMPVILIVDDDKNTREGVARHLSESYETLTAANGSEALSLLGGREDVDVVLTDLMMPSMDGIELLEKIRAASGNTAVVMITGYSSIESAVDAMRKGAYDYITKPIDLVKLEAIIRNALENKRLRTENSMLRQRVRECFRAEALLGSSPKTAAILELIKQVAPTTATVLIQGESGTGKELAANMIHFDSLAAAGPFIKANCSVFAEGVLESELFGHVKGAFTGAVTDKKGRFELADNGTLFLDEVGDLPLSTQIKLLRVLQEKEFERVGGTKTIQVNVRILSATNRNLYDLVKEGKFREDLFYRLRVITVNMPPLRERKEDVPLLAHHYLDRFAEMQNKAVRAIAPEAMQLMEAYGWPGNVRELINCIESAVVLCRGDVIEVENLPPYIFEESIREIPKTAYSLYEVEKKTILETLHRVGGNKVEAAKTLAIGLRTLYRKLKEYGVQ